MSRTCIHNTGLMLAPTWIALAMAALQATHVFAVFPFDPTATCYKYCNVYQPMEDEAEVAGTVKLYQMAQGTWVGVDVNITNDFLVPPAREAVTHVHEQECTPTYGSRSDVFYISNDAILQIDLPPNADNVRARQAQFEQFLPPISESGNVSSHIIHGRDGSGHVCCDLVSCQPPQGAECLAYANRWTVVDESIVSDAVGAVSIFATTDGETWIFTDLDLTPTLAAGGTSSSATPAAAASAAQNVPEAYDLVTEDLDLVVVQRGTTTVVDGLEVDDLPVSGTNNRIGTELVSKDVTGMGLNSGRFSIAVRDDRDQIIAEAPLSICPDFFVPPTEAVGPASGADADAGTAANATPGDATGAAAASADAGDGGGSSSSLSTGAIVGIACGAAAAVVLLAAAVFVLARKRRAPRGGRGSDDDTIIHMGGTNASVNAVDGKPAPGYYSPYGYPSGKQGSLRATVGSGQDSGPYGVAPYGMVSPGTTYGSQDARLNLQPTGYDTIPEHSSVGSLAARGAVAGGALVGGGGAVYVPSRVPGSGTPQSHVTMTAVTDWTQTMTMMSHASKTSARTNTNDTVYDPATLNDALDDMHARGVLMLGTYRVAPSRGTRAGGQALVRFLQDKNSGERFVIKFFESRVAFNREAELYAREDLRRLVPALRRVEPNTFGDVAAPNGTVFPPFLIVEKGESLDEWMARAHPDVSQSLSMLLHITERLQQLHSLGIAHRDLKPSNVLWRTAYNEWTLIDYGCAGQIGETVPLSFTLLYAAPEVLAVLQRGERTIEVSAAMDMWSLGVMAFEVLTRERAFAASDTPEMIIDQILGNAPAPWDEAHPDYATRAARYNISRPLRTALRALLSRDPLERPTSDDLLVSFNSMFGGTTATAD